MKQLRCALYPRVSTEEQQLHGLSLPAQVKDLTEYANRMNYQIVDVYADEGVSARKPVSKRPALLRLLRDVEKGLIDLILVTKLDRWFRNIKEYQLTQEILERHGCYWKTIFEEYDTSTANGQMVVNIMLAVAQNECDRTSERIKTVLRHKVQNGEHVTGAAPYGYLTVNKKLEKDPRRAAIVEDIFSHYFITFSKRNTVSYILGKYQDPKLTENKINRILGSETYCGRYRGISDYYPAYITETQFLQIRQISASRSRRSSVGAYRFSGLLKCPVCGRNLTGTLVKRTLKDGSVRHYRRYRCQVKFHPHPGPCITESVVENYLIKQLVPLLSPGICRTHPVKNRPPKNKGLQIQGELERLNKLYQKGRISAPYYESQYALLKQRLKSLQADPQPEAPSPETNASHLTVDWVWLYRSLDDARKNVFWKRILREITFDEKTRKINGFSFFLPQCSNPRTR